MSTELITFKTNSAKKATNFINNLNKVKRVTNRKWKKSEGGLPFYDKDLTLDQLLKDIIEIGITHFSCVFHGDGWSLGGCFKSTSDVNHSFGIYLK